MPNDKNNDYLWYSVVLNNDPIQQGDLIDDLKVYFPVIPAKNGDSVEVNDVLDYDVVVMTQSCDLANLSDDSLVLLCPRQSFAKMFQKEVYKDNWNKLRKGSFIHSHLINKCDLKDHEFDYQVVIFETVISMPLGLLKAQLNNRPDRVRMMPPYREYMAQAFAMQFMRIGLPNDLPSTCPY